jgi:hypothetical protein
MLLRALACAGIPAMVLLSKADLLAPGDRVPMTDYVREQLRRELELDLPIDLVSTVGAEESLLTAWFDRKLSPLLDWHRVLARASLQRKIAHLRESLIAAMETLRARTARAGHGKSAEAGARSAQRLLDEADEAIRRTREQASKWWEDRRTLAEGVFRFVANVVVSARDPRAPGDCGGLIEAALVDRGREAYALVTGLQELLAGTLERLSSIGTLGQADTASLRSFHSGGLPAINLDGLRGGEYVERPWWSALAPSLAVRATERSIRARNGEGVTKAVESYDRQLESWLHAKLAGCIKLFEAQAGPFREQVRRLAAEPAGADIAVDVVELERDLSELRGTQASEPAAVG